MTTDWRPDLTKRQPVPAPQGRATDEVTTYHDPTIINTPPTDPNRHQAPNRANKLTRRQRAQKKFTTNKHRLGVHEEQGLPRNPAKSGSHPQHNT